MALQSLRTHWRRFPFWAVGLVLSAYIGSRFPDVDQHTDLLTHRSILTHGLLIPLVLFLIVSLMKNDRLRDFLLISMTSIAIHLCFDLFPRAWYGYALIHIPNFGWTPEIVSKVWMFTSVVFCMYASISLINKGSQVLLLVLGALSIFTYQSFGEARFFAPMATLFIATAVAIWWKFTRSSQRITVFVRIIQVTIATIRAPVKLLAGSYRIARDEYDISMVEQRPFHKFLAGVVRHWFTFYRPKGD
jgi:hypothetical protein